MSLEPPPTNAAAMRLFALGAFFALLAVAAGAFGAHGLRARVSPAALAMFETGARYQMYHALGMLAVAWAMMTAPGRLAGAAGWFFAIGILLFSGSLYLLALTGLRAIGAVTPIGGLAFIAGWGCLAAWAWRAGRVDRTPRT